MADMAQAELKVGDKAPPFELQGSDGKTYKLSDFEGKQAVVVAWFPKAFTGGCTAECSSFRVSPLKESFTLTLLGNKEAKIETSPGSGLDKFDVAFFTASVDDQATNKKYAEALKLDYPILCDPSKEVARAYGVVHEGREVAERWTFIIGKDGKILHIDRQVKTAAHGADIAKKLEELGVPRK
jgi:peroxiredoxin Q/BCP